MRGARSEREISLKHRAKERTISLEAWEVNQSVSFQSEDVNTIRMLEATWYPLSPPGSEAG